MKKRHFLLFSLVVLVLFFSYPGMGGKGETDRSGYNFAQVILPKKGECFKVNNPIHVGIKRMGEVYESGKYNDDVVYSVISAYWTPGAWDLNKSWCNTTLNGYLVYAITRVAIMHRHQILQHHSNTQVKLELMLNDYTNLDINNIPLNLFHGYDNNNPETWNEWNSISEDYMGFALGFAAADAWFESSNNNIDIKSLVQMAFTINPNPIVGGTLITGNDPDLLVTGTQVMMRNHKSLSPVYATAIIKHIGDINLIYQIAGLGQAITSADNNIIPNVQALFDWVVAKIDWENGYIFRRNACQHSNGGMIDCNDSDYCLREPVHYPMGFLSGLGITGPLNYFGSPCCSDGGQGFHNYYFNCIFTCMNIQPAREPELEILYCNNNGAHSYTVSDDQMTHQVSFIFDASQGRFEERPGNGCGNPVKDNPHFVCVRVIPHDYTIVDCEVRDAWDTGWFQCPDIAIYDWIPNSTFITLNTDPYQTDVSQSGCPWNYIPRYLIGTIGFFQIRLYDDLGNVFFRRINLKRIRMIAQQLPPSDDQ